MTVSSSQKTEDSAQADGNRHIAFEFTFHTGDVVVKRFLAPSDYDDTTGLAEWTAIVEQEMIESEDEENLGKAEKGEIDSSTVVPIHPETDTAIDRQKRWLRKLVRWAMKNQDIKWVRIVLYPVWYRFKFIESYTPTQIQNILNITVAQYNKFNDRLTVFHNSLSFIDDDDDYLDEVD